MIEVTTVVNGDKVPLRSMVDKALGQFDIKFGNRVTVASISIGNKTYTGDAKCHPKDVWDPKIGAGLAIANALKEAARDFEQATQKAIDKNERR